VALLRKYDTPAGLRDLAEGSRFYDDWHDTVRDIVRGVFDPGPPGPPEPVPVEPAARRAPVAPAAPADRHWLDPLVDDAEVVLTRALSWIAFPRAVQTVQFRDRRDEGFAAADADRVGRQDEYFEWHTTTREPDNKITKVVFVTETPEYWRLLARTDPDKLLERYRELVSPEVQMADLFVEEETPEGTTRKVYNEANRWNTTDGIVHFIVGINNLNAAVGLARMGATNPGPVDAYTDPLSTPTSVDSYLPRDVAALVRNHYRVAVHDPVGLYIHGWDDTGWTTPDGSPVGNYWRVTRGRPGAALRVEYEVPEQEGFVVGDIRIGGRPITHGGQIAEHMTVSLPVAVARMPS
jgi:hypothetical protein